MAHERREKVKRSVSPLLSAHTLGKEKMGAMLPEQLYFLQSPPEEEPEYHPDTAAQGTFLTGYQFDTLFLKSFTGREFVRQKLYIKLDFPN
jgi:hypothetical protein